MVCGQYQQDVDQPVDIWWRRSPKVHKYKKNVLTCTDSVTTYQNPSVSRRLGNFRVSFRHDGHFRPIFDLEGDVKSFGK